MGEGWEEVGMRFGTAAWRGGGFVVVVEEGLEGFCEMERGVGISLSGGTSGGIVFALLSTEF